MGQKCQRTLCELVLAWTRIKSSFQKDGGEKMGKDSGKYTGQALSRKQCLKVVETFMLRKQTLEPWRAEDTSCLRGILTRYFH